MPNIVDALPKTERGRARKYDFTKLYNDLVANGKAAELIEGEDFTCSPASMRQYLYRDAPEQGFKVRVRTREAEDGRGVVTFAVEKNGDKPKVAPKPQAAKSNDKSKS